MKGRRIYPEKGEAFQPSDYGIEDGVWHCRTPDPNIGLGSLANHEVIEHEDGTITVSPSIIVGYPDGDKTSWHGFLRRGEWEKV